MWLLLAGLTRIATCQAELAAATLDNLADMADMLQLHWLPGPLAGFGHCSITPFPLGLKARPKPRF